MTFTKWGLIYLGVGVEDPATDRAEIERGGLTTIVVAVPDRSDAARVAVELVDGGAQSIELCGGFGPQGAADVIAAVGDRVPVGAVGYGAEAIHQLAALFPAA
jgi:2-keto-3-deoxy-6-phosphogluconate aldolase